MKKKLWVGILVAALVLVIGAATALAVETRPYCQGRGNAGTYFVDENEDGICDRYATGDCGGGYGRGHGGHGRGYGHGCHGGCWR